MKKKTISLRDFIKDNEKLILVFGIFLALLPFSFESIKKIDETYAGIFSIAVTLILLLLLRNFLFNKKKELSFEANLFVLCLVIIGGIVVLATLKLYPKMTLSFLDLILSSIYLIGGLYLSSKILPNSEKIEKNPWILILFIFLAIIITFFSIDKVINSILLDMNLVYRPFLTIEYQSIFFAGVYIFLILYGIGSSIILIKDFLYKKGLLKLIKKVKQLNKKQKRGNKK